jgi:putative glutamine amidotransferase
MHLISRHAPSRPIVLIPACNRTLGRHPFHVAGRKYIEAVRLAGALPLVVPWVRQDELDDLLSLADGVLLTGSPSNVHPRHFGEHVLDQTLPLDPERDDWTLPLIPRLIEQGVPLFAICRGFQEVNVALGGSLHQAVHQVPGLNDHRDDEALPVEEQYGPAHPVEIEAGGLLAKLLGKARITVNSLHGQGIHRLASGLRVEARAPDGLVEAFSANTHTAFHLAVQWHPEWMADTNPVSTQLFKAFGEACRVHLNSRLTT